MLIVSIKLFYRGGREDGPRGKEVTEKVAGSIPGTDRGCTPAVSWWHHLTVPRQTVCTIPASVPLSKAVNSKTSSFSHASFRFSRSSCAPLRWPVSQEASWLPHWPMEVFVQSQASVCWALKPFATPWVSCTPAACTTSLESLPSTWVNGNSGICLKVLPVLLLRVVAHVLFAPLVQVGLPAKSGISGAVLLVVPNVMGMMCWSPPLDRLGNSIRGILFCQVISRHSFIDWCSSHFFLYLHPSNIPSSSTH